MKNILKYSISANIFYGDCLARDFFFNIPCTAKILDKFKPLCIIHNIYFIIFLQVFINEYNYLPFLNAVMPLLMKRVKWVKSRTCDIYKTTAVVCIVDCQTSRPSRLNVVIFPYDYAGKVIITLYNTLCIIYRTSVYRFNTLFCRGNNINIYNKLLF